MSQDSFCLFACFSNPDSPPVTPTSENRPHVWWLEFRPNTTRGVCSVQVCSPNSGIWECVPIARTLLLNGTPIGRGEREYRLDTARVAWGMLARAGWSTTPIGAENAKPVTLYTYEQVEQFTKGTGEMLQGVGNAQGQIW